MRKAVILVAGGVMLAATAACTTPHVTDQQLECAGGAVAGGALGGVIGNQFGSGSGRTAMTALGAGAGAVAGSRAAGC